MNPPDVVTHRPRKRRARFASVISNFRWRLRERYRHAMRAWRYARRTLTADDAQTIMLHCRDPAGWYPLTVLAVEDALEDAHKDFEAHPELPRLVADGCARVADKWDDFGDTLYEARRWALELAQTYAEQENIVLARRSENDSTDADDIPS